ncbi:MAG TPA: Crp/Fnr family transcriptional regulator [Candidatus Saccharimonadales bacterium]|nr:Crp/Fnr family transcriptional regulator [Candidatus Saccharimonadales bacterium]
MTPTKFRDFVHKHGTAEQYKTGQVFHGHDFPAKLFVLKTGYVKRYQATNPHQRVIELIYGPGRIISLSQLYAALFGVEQNQEDLIYVYEAMTDVEAWVVTHDQVMQALQKGPELYKDFFYESGLTLRANINRLASNALKDDYKKVTHQIKCLADEFGDVVQHKGKPVTKILAPLRPIDMAEQLNISVEVADAVMSSLNKNGIIVIEGSTVYVPDGAQLKDEYLKTSF